MRNRNGIARTATAKAMRLRSGHRIEPDSAVDPVDFALTLGIQVHFEPLASLEGLYIAGQQRRIILGSDRPSGRRNYNCAHEIGHDAHGHATRVDELIQGAKPYDPDEFAADRFAAALLMPKIAVLAAFARRNWDPKKPSPDQLLIISSELGVGYSSIAGYMSSTLDLVSNGYAKRLMKMRPKDLRAKLVGRDLPYHLVVIDSGWRRNQINMEVGDVALINGAVDDPGGHLKFRVRPDGQPELIAKSAGEARFATTHCSGSIRISSRCYRGLADYRYLSISDVVDRKSAA